MVHADGMPSIKKEEDKRIYSIDSITRDNELKQEVQHSLNIKEEPLTDEKDLDKDTYYNNFIYNADISIEYEIKEEDSDKPEQSVICDKDFSQNLAIYRGSKDAFLKGKQKKYMHIMRNLITRSI